MRKRTTKKENVFSWKDNKIKYEKENRGGTNQTNNK